MRRVILFSIVSLFLAGTQVGCSIKGNCGCDGDSAKQAANHSPEGHQCGGGQCGDGHCGDGHCGGEEGKHADGETCGMSK
jgi:hypothetical protein